nr:DUF3302 domain-containing protein [uncultured Enterobacter sp.]
MFLDYFALAVLIIVMLVIFYGVIIIHDIPYILAKNRNHPHQDAIHVAGWISLFTLHVIWPFLWVWATLYREDRGWGMSGKTEDYRENEVADLKERIERIEAELKLHQQSLSPQPEQNQNNN